MVFNGHTRPDGNDGKVIRSNVILPPCFVTLRHSRRPELIYISPIPYQKTIVVESFLFDSQNRITNCYMHYLKQFARKFSLELSLAFQVGGNKKTPWNVLATVGTLASFATSTSQKKALSV